MDRIKQIEKEVSELSQNLPPEFVMLCAEQEALVQEELALLSL